VVKVNQALNETIDDLDVTPYHSHWICMVDGESLDAELPSLKIGKSAVAFFQEEIERFVAFMKEAAAAEATGPATDNALCIGAMERLNDDQWDRAAKEFFSR
jgi:hypothetical protein